MKAEIALEKPGVFEQEAFENLCHKHSGRWPDLKLEGVTYHFASPYTTAIARISVLTNGRWTGKLLGIGTSKRNPVDPQRSIKGRAYSFSRAVKDALGEK